MDKLKKVSLRMSHLDINSKKFKNLEHKLEELAKKKLEEDKTCQKTK